LENRSFTSLKSGAENALPNPDHCWQAINLSRCEIVLAKADRIFLYPVKPGLQDPSPLEQTRGDGKDERQTKQITPQPQLAGRKVTI
jgi:hypothetical protein